MDASDLGHGIVLAQKYENGNERPILYLSEKFASPERNDRQLKKSVQLHYMA